MKVTNRIKVLSIHNLRELAHCILQNRQHTHNVMVNGKNHIGKNVKVMNNRKTIPITRSGIYTSVRILGTASNDDDYGCDSGCNYEKEA